MLFYKPLFSFVVAFAAASSVVASTIPVARGDGYAPPTPQPTDQCNEGDTYCCNTWTNSQNPLLEDFGVPVSILDGNLIDGLDCEGVLSGGTCNSQKLCCQHSFDDSYSIVSVNCVGINAL